MATFDDDKSESESYSLNGPVATFAGKLLESVTYSNDDNKVSYKYDDLGRCKTITVRDYIEVRIDYESNKFHMYSGDEDYGEGSVTWNKEGYIRSLLFDNEEYVSIKYEYNSDSLLTKYSADFIEDYYEYEEIVEYKITYTDDAIKVYGTITEYEHSKKDLEETVNVTYTLGNVKNEYGQFTCDLLDDLDDYSNAIALIGFMGKAPKYFATRAQFEVYDSEEDETYRYTEKLDDVTLNEDGTILKEGDYVYGYTSIGSGSTRAIVPSWEKSGDGEKSVIDLFKIKRKSLNRNVQIEG